MPSDIIVELSRKTQENTNKKIKAMLATNSINIIEKFPLCEKQWTPHINWRTHDQ
jgi:hypothetical protein